MILKSRSVAVLLFSAVALAKPVFADFESAMSAYEAENYPTAVALFEEEARNGHALAQFHLGMIHYQGLGQQENHEQAAHWLSASAEQGEMNAQSLLGRLYLHGEGMEQNDTHAYKWLTIAYVNGDRGSLQLLGQLRRDMGEERVIEAERLALDWLDEFTGLNDTAEE